MYNSIDNQPLVSVGIPTYNRPDKLLSALTNVTKQTYGNLEIIISDNCSPDKKVTQIAKEFVEKDCRVKYFRQTENLGALLNFQFVLKKSSGKYFMWHPDDYEMVDTNYIASLAGEIKNNFLIFPLFILSYLGEEGSKTFFSEYENLSNVQQYLLAWCSNGGGYPFYGLYNRKILMDSGYIFYLEKCKDWKYYNEGLFLHQIFAHTSVKYYPKAKFLVDTSSTNINNLSQRTLLEAFTYYAFESIRLYSESSLTAGNKEEVLQLIYKRYGDYILSLSSLNSSPENIIKRVFNKLRKILKKWLFWV